MATSDRGVGTVVAVLSVGDAVGVAGGCVSGPVLLQACPMSTSASTVSVTRGSEGERMASF
ncbi:MAG: hypothetical protein IID38_04010 [Planctomycetes bacterium]|nr:hypothetical protein [Planctomycetota bacterium]